MKTSKAYNELLSNIKAGYLVNNNQLTYMMSLLNGDKEELKAPVKAIINDAVDGLALSDEQVNKGLTWLNNLWMSPTGKERKNNPFGYREQAVLEDKGATIEMYGYYDAGNAYHSYNVPIYLVSSKIQGTFEYVVSGGEIKIIG